MLDMRHRDAFRPAGGPVHDGKASQAEAGLRQGLTSGLSFRTLIRALRSPDSELSAAESASTLFRFFRSKHVVDLKLIIAAALLLFTVLSAIVLAIGWVDVR